MFKSGTNVKYKGPGAVELRQWGGKQDFSDITMYKYQGFCLSAEAGSGGGGSMEGFLVFMFLFFNFCDDKDGTLSLMHAKHSKPRLQPLTGGF